MLGGLGQADGSLIFLLLQTGQKTELVCSLHRLCSWVSHQTPLFLGHSGDERLGSESSPVTLVSRGTRSVSPWG